jgi:hypothetical protein
MWGVGELEKGGNTPRGLQIHRGVNPPQVEHTLSTYLLSILLRNQTWELN